MKLDDQYNRNLVLFRDAKKLRNSSSFQLREQKILKEDIDIWDAICYEHSVRYTFTRGYYGLTEYGVPCMMVGYRTEDSRRAAICIELYNKYKSVRRSKVRYTED